MAYMRCCLKSVILPESIETLGNEVFKNCSLEKLTVKCSDIKLDDALKGCEIKKICGYNDSYAQKYAETNDIEFELLSDETTDEPEIKTELILKWSKNIYEILELDADAETAEIPEKVTIDGTEYTITGIENDFFRGMANLKSVKLPSTLKTIGDKAFLNHPSLTEIEIPEGVTSIGQNAFSNCEALTTVKLPESLISIGNGAFRDCKSLVSVEIPENVKEISAFAFYHCVNLENLNIPDGVTSLENCVVGECKALQNLIIPDSVTNIHQYAFYHCYALHIIRLPKDIKKIPESMFEEANVETLILPDGIEEIGERAFFGCSLKEIVIPDSVKIINKDAFANCGHLTSIKLPSSLIEIAPSAFNRCYSLESIDIPEGVTTIGENAFLGCQELKSVHLPDSIRTIESWAFGKCWDLETINLPEGLETIGAYAFSSCYGLGKIKLPESLKTIGTLAFTSAEIYELTLPATMKKLNTNMFMYGTVTRLVIPDGLEEITYNLDSTVKIICGSENSIASEWGKEHNIPYILPDAPDPNFFTFSLANGAARLSSVECYGDVVIPSTYTYAGKTYNVSSILHDVFRDNTLITSVEIPETMKTIESNAFAGCTKLRKVSIPESIETIGDEAFTGCTIDEMTIKCSDIELKNALKGCDIKKIYAYASSAAQTYAEKNGIEFVAISDKSENYTPGDANCDGNIDLADVVLIMQALANPSRFGLNGSEPSHITLQGLENADVTGNDGMTNLDALTIQKYKLALIDTLG